MTGQIKIKSEGTNKYKESVGEIFGQGNLSVLRLISSKNQKSVWQFEASDVFCDSKMTPDQIGAAGLRIFVLLHGGKDTDNFSSLCYAKYMKMASTISSVKPEKLSPTERAVYFDFVCVYCQV